MKRFGFLLLLFAPLLQAQMAVGPERFVCEPRFVTPNAADVAAATNGIETLVAFQPYGVESSIYAQRLDANAQPLTPHGFPVARGTRYLGGVASNHDGYVVFWVTVREAWTTYVDAAGNAAAPQRVVTTPNIIFWPRIASNGTGYLAAWTDSTANSEQAMAVRLDGRGKAAGEAFPISERRNNAGINALASDGRDYLVAVERLVPDGATVAPRSTLVPVSAGGAVGTTADLPMFVYALAYTAGGFVAVWTEPGKTNAAAVDASGHVGAASVISNDGFESASSNGSDVMVVVEAPFRTRSAVRIRRNGDAIDTIESSVLTTLPVLATIRAAALHTGDYFALAVAGGEPVDIAMIRPSTGAAHGLLTFAAAQDSPAIATDGHLHVLAWREGTLLRAARVRAGVPLDQAGLDIAYAPPAHAIASGSNRTLIAWTEMERVGEAGTLRPVRLSGRMLASDGTLSTPFDIAQVGRDGFAAIDLGAAAATESGFVVLWQQQSRLWRAFLDTEGHVLAASQLDLTMTLPFPGPALTRSGDGFVVVYIDQRELFAAPLHADGTVAGPRQQIGTSDLSDVASDGNGHVLAVWTRNDEIWTQPLDARGAPAGNAHLLGSGARARVTWNGSAFTVVSGPNVALVAADGSVIAPLTATFPPEATATVAAADVVAYLRSGIEAGVGDVNVLFVRRLAPARRRAAR